MPPALCTSTATKRPAGLRSDKQRRARADGLEIVDGKRHVGLARHGQQVQHRVGGAAAWRPRRRWRSRTPARVQMSRGRRLSRDGIHDDLAAAEGDVVLARIHLRDRRRAHGREADQLHHRGHGVGGELAAAGARAGAGVVFDGEQFVVRDAARRVGAHGLEDVLDA